MENLNEIHYRMFNKIKFLNEYINDIEQLLVSKQIHLDHTFVREYQELSDYIENDNVHDSIYNLLLDVEKRLDDILT